jgi:hypothetical protein
MLKNSDKLTDNQKAKFIEINQANLLTSRRLEAERELYGNIQ